MAEYIKAGEEWVKKLFLMRHAKSSWSDADLRDIDRPLNGRGKIASKNMAAFYAQNKIRPDLILCSSARRTRQTYGFLLEEFDHIHQCHVLPDIYEAPSHRLLAVLMECGDEFSSVMMIGHNPGMEGLAEYLCGGGDEMARQSMAAKFPTGACAQFSLKIKGWSQLERGCARLKAFHKPREIG